MDTLTDALIEQLQAELLTYGEDANVGNIIELTIVTNPYPVPPHFSRYACAKGITKVIH